MLARYNVNESVRICEMTPRELLLPLLISCLLTATAGRTTTFSNIQGGNVDFPAGAVSFADELVSFAPGLIFNSVRQLYLPLPAFLAGQNTLGVPDVNLANAINCSLNQTAQNCKFISLGVGGVLTLRFTDNVLVGSGNAAPDLFVFEAGPAEQTFVDISADGVTWLSLGARNSFAQGIDIDAFGVGPNDSFSYVRLRDNPAIGQFDGDTVGADIDAIGAISTRVVPLPATVWFLASALAGLAVKRTERDKKNA
jgi:hypothetical protein